MQQTPIEKTIIELERMKSKCNEENHFNKGMTTAYEIAITQLKLKLPYEKTYHRNIAEKAISNTIKIMQNTSDSQQAQLEVETYLNQNHPL